MKPFNRVDLISPDIIREGDRVNYFLVRLTNSDGSPVDVSNSNVTWSMANKKGRVIADKTAEKTSDLGVIKLGFKVGDQTGYGKFEVQIEVENGGVSEFYPSDNSLEVFIPKNINNLEHTPVAYMTVNDFQNSVSATLATSEEAKTTASQAKQQAESTQAQLDTIVVNGDSSVEAAQARVSDSEVDETTYPNLKARLDSQANILNKKVKSTLILLSDYSYLSNGEDWSVALQQAINEAGINGANTIKFPYGYYKISGVVAKSDISFVCDKGTVVQFLPGGLGFNLDDCHDVSFEGFIFDGELQLSGDDRMFYGKRTERVSFRSNLFKNGTYGVYLSDTSKSTLESNEAFGFSYWPFYVEGCENFKYLRNTCYENDYDGLKIAGVNVGSPAVLIKDVIVSENVCYANARDGLDIAGNNIENVVVTNNIFEGNSLNGIDIKNVYQGSYVRNIFVENNKSTGNLESQANVQFNVPGFSVNNIFIENNKCIAPDITTGSAMRVVGFSKSCVVKNNYIISAHYGIRVINCNATTISENFILENSRCIYVETQSGMSEGVVIENNKIHSKNSSCVWVWGSGVTGTLIRFNEFKTDLDTNRMQDTGSGTIAYENFVKGVTGQPSGRAMKGEVFKLESSAIVAGGYSEYVAINTSGSATFKGRNKIQD